MNAGARAARTGRAWLADGVILAGLLVNLAFVVLILVHYVL